MVALAVIAVILAPAAILRVLCVGHSCDEPETLTASIPFCSLPDGHRAAIAAGFREGRSPDVIAVEDTANGQRVPLFFYGEGFGEAEIPSGTSLDRVAPTIARAVGFRRAHPEVRSGIALEGTPIVSDARLVLIVALKGIGASNFDGWSQIPVSRGTSRTSSTQAASTGSLPIDPASSLTTIGTGGLPNQHGITGRLIRNDAGRLVSPWGRGAPVSVIATLADDFDERFDQRAKIGLVATERTDRGLIGGNWYIDHDRDDLRFVGRNMVVSEVRRLLSSGYGRDDTIDLLAVAVDAPSDRAGEIIASLIESGLAASNDKLVVAVAGTGASDNGEVNVARIEQAIPGRRDLIEGAVPGGFFVDQGALADTGITEDEVIAAIKGTGRFVDVFASITVSFARYC